LSAWYIFAENQYLILAILNNVYITFVDLDFSNIEIGKTTAK